MTTVTEKSSTGLDANVAAALSYLVGFLTGIVFLLIEKESKFVRFHAMQSTLVFVAIFAISIVLGAIPIIGWALYPILMLASLILWLVLLFKAFQGEKFKLPIVGDIAEQKA